MQRMARLAAIFALLVTGAYAAPAFPRPVPVRYRGSHRLQSPRYTQQHRLAMRTAPRGHHPEFLPLLSPTVNGGFFAASALSVGGQSFGTPAVGDFNGDGNLDLAVVASTDYGVTFAIAMLPGKGDGTFGTSTLTATSYGYSDRLYSADLNGDGNDDVILVHSGNAVGSFDVFLSNGSGFSGPTTYSVSAANPAAVATIDLNGDGKPDLVIADGLPVPDNPNPSPSVSTFLNNGDGTFGMPSQVPYPGPIASGVLADVNGDGKLDLVSNSQVILASSTGGYQQPSPLIPPPGQVTCLGVDGVVQVGDLNGDGYPDIATADCQNNTVTIYLNGGSGTFQSGISFWAGYYPQGISLGDLNGDNKSDIVVTNADSADSTVLLGNGDGTFQVPRVGFALGGIPYAQPVLADFDKDLKLDLVSANYEPDILLDVTYLHGFGDGTFAAALDYFSPLPPAGQYAYGLGIATADLNGDGKPDFALANSGSANVGITVFLDSTGGLQPGVNYGSGGNFDYVGSGDFNGDGKVDLVASDSATANIDLFLGNGDGTLASPSIFNTGGASPVQGLVVGDFNNDGKPDIAVLTQPSDVIVLINNGSGGFTTPVHYSISGFGAEIAAGDLNNDGTLDLVVVQPYSNFLSILSGNGDGTFTAKPDFDLGSSYPVSVAIGDWNGDGRKDIAVTIDDNNTGMGVAVALGNGDGTFQPAILYPATLNITDQPYPGEIAAADVNVDGNLDLVYVNSEFGTVGVLYGTASGVFGPPNEFPVGGYPYGLVMADVNGDGGIDAIAASGSISAVTVLLNSSGSMASILSSTNPSVFGQIVTFTATVTAAVRGVTIVPSGTVTLYDNGSPIGTGALNAGQVTFNVSSLAVGGHSVTASYSGDSTFFHSTSAAFLQVVNSGPLPGYQVVSSPTNATIQQGQSANFTITVTPVNGYQGTVMFSCGALPQGVSCQFNPALVTPSNGPVQSTLTVNTLSSKADNHLPLRRAQPLWAAGLFGLILGGVKRRRCLSTLLSVTAALAMLMMTSCSSGSSASATSAKTTQTISVVASSVNGGNLSQQINITLTIEP